MNRFQDKRVIVTGAAAGFGAAIARGFAAEGARVLVADLDEAGAKDVAAGLPDAIAFGIEVDARGIEPRAPDAPHQQRFDEVQTRRPVGQCVELLG